MEKAYSTGLTKTYTTPREKNDRKLFLLDWWEPHITLAQLHTIQVPSLIMAGDHDVISLPTLSSSTKTSRTPTSGSSQTRATPR